MNKANLSKKATVINPEYRTPAKDTSKKQLKFQNITISNKIDNKTFTMPSKNTFRGTEESK